VIQLICKSEAVEVSSVIRKERFINKMRLFTVHASWLFVLEYDVHTIPGDDDRPHTARLPRLNRGANARNLKCR